MNEVFRSFTTMTKAMLYLALMYFLSLSPAFCQDMKTIQLAAFDYPPFYSEENGEVQGIAVELVRELFARMDIQTEIRMYPLKRALAYLEDGKADGLMILIKTAEREAYIHYTDPVLTVQGLIWTAADRKDVKVNFDRLEDLIPYKIGVTLGYSYGQKFDDMLKQMHVDTGNSDYNNFRKLLVHRMDIFPANEVVARSLFKKHPELKGKFVHSDQSFIEWILHMGISQKSSLVHRISDINTILADLKNEGFIHKTVRKYTE
jgi:polar amino acid transport system substrate-binding protein